MNEQNERFEMNRNEGLQLQLILRRVNGYITEGLTLKERREAGIFLTHEKKNEANERFLMNKHERLQHQLKLFRLNLERNKNFTPSQTDIDQGLLRHQGSMPNYKLTVPSDVILHYIRQKNPSSHDVQYIFL